MVLVPRRLSPIHLLPFIGKRLGSNYYLKRAISSGHLMMAIDSAEGMNNDGRIWIHRPFRITDVASSASSLQPTVSSCPLPKSTPFSAREDKLHYLYSTSSAPEKTLEQMYESKVDFYQSQFQSRVVKEAWSRIERRTIQSPHGLGKVDATIYFPESKDDTSSTDPNSSSKLLGICLHVHGGGWLWGDSHDQVAHRCLEMAQSLNVAVVSVEYSMFCKVNKHQSQKNENTNALFDPVNDVSIAIDWIESDGAKELNAQTSFIASGESSGAHLLLLAMLDRRDRDNVALLPPVPLPPINQSTQPSPFSPSWKCLNLVYGVYDISGSPSIRADGDSTSPLCGNDLLWLYDMYYSRVQKSIQETNNDGAQVTMARQHPSLSPLYANLSYLPPSLLSVGTADPLFDDTLFMANKLAMYGNNVELAIYEGGEHGIGHFGVQEDEEMGVRARRHTLDFMKEHLNNLQKE